MVKYFSNKGSCIPPSKHKADPSNYPQKRFNSKACRWCGEEFTPNAPCHLYCSDYCSIRAADDAYLRNRYGIGLIEYERLLEEQNHRCAICGGEGFKLKEDQNTKLVIDHDHDTGEVRGLLCHNCNRALGLFQDNPDRIKQALAYLEGATTIPKGE